jgi:hypothetical protein
LIFDKLSDALDIGQKKNKIRNITYAMHKKDHTLKSDGKPPKSKWVLDLTEKDED